MDEMSVLDDDCKRSVNMMKFKHCRFQRAHSSISAVGGSNIPET